MLRVLYELTKNDISLMYNEMLWKFWRFFRETWVHKFYMQMLYRFHSEHRYNILKTGLPYDYYDLDTRILYGVMHEFSAFYKNSISSLRRDVDWNLIINDSTTDDYSKEFLIANLHYKTELDTIYDWWIKYLTITEEHENYWLSYTEYTPYTEDHRDHNKMFELEEQLEQEANEMLSRLMLVRRVLWD